jgi:hypothetical protein
MKNLETANKGIKSLAKEEPALVEERFGYDVPGYMYGGIANFQYGGPAGMFNIDQDYIRRYYEDVLGINVDDLGEEDSEEAMANALARAYGAPSEGMGLTLDQWVTEIQHLALQLALMLKTKHQMHIDFIQVKYLKFMHKPKAYLSLHYSTSKRSYLYR